MKGGSPHSYSERWLVLHAPKLLKGDLLLRHFEIEEYFCTHKFYSTDLSLGVLVTRATLLYGTVQIQSSCSTIGNVFPSFYSTQLHLYILL
jgi:hypothetical protein